MSRSRYVITEPDKPHFLTCTVVEWLPVFTVGGDERSELGRCERRGRWPHYGRRHAALTSGRAAPRMARCVKVNVRERRSARVGP